MNNADPFLNDHIGYRTSDPVLPDHYEYNSSGAKIEDDRLGLTALGLAQEKNIDWYTNGELINDNSYDSVH